MEKRRVAVLEKIKGKQLFEMGNDGEPTWRKIEVLEKRASIQFHFKRSETSTVYYPTISYEGKKLKSLTRLRTSFANNRYGWC